MRKVLVPLAEGFETIEALAVVDIFRRAEVDVVTAAVSSERQVNSSHNIPVIADALLLDCLQRKWDLVVIPGGVEGSENLAKSPELVKILKKQDGEGKLYGAICAAPAIVLERHGLLAGKKTTCHPGFISQIPSSKRQEEAVVVDQNCITGRGAGHAVAFALTLLEELEGKETRKRVEQGLALS